MPDGRGKNPNSWKNSRRWSAHHRWAADKKIMSDELKTRGEHNAEHLKDRGRDDLGRFMPSAFPS